MTNRDAVKKFGPIVNTPDTKYTGIWRKSDFLQDGGGAIDALRSGIAYLVLSMTPGGIQISNNITFGQTVEQALRHWSLSYGRCLVEAKVRELPAPVSEPAQVTLKPNGSEPYAYIETEIGKDLEVYQKGDADRSRYLLPLRKWADGNAQVFNRSAGGVNLVKPADRKSCAQYVPVYPAFYIPQYHEPMVEISFVL